MVLLPRVVVEWGRGLVRTASQGDLMKRQGEEQTGPGSGRGGEGSQGGVGEDQMEGEVAAAGRAKLESISGGAFKLSQPCTFVPLGAWLPD